MSRSAASSARILARRRHRERIVGEVDLLLLLVPLVHREVDDPAELEAVLVDQPELLADLGAGGAGELDKLLRLAGDEEDRVAAFSPSSWRSAFAVAPARGCWRSDRGRRPRPCRAPEDVAEARLALALGPGVHAVAEGARAAARRRDRPHRGLGPSSSMRANTLKPQPRKTSDTSCISIGLRRSGLSVPYLGIASR